MTIERIKEIQETTGYPNSVSVQQALLQVWNEVWNEVAQESVPLDGLVMPKIADGIKNYYRTEGQLTLLNNIKAVLGINYELMVKMAITERKVLLGSIKEELGSNFTA